MKKGALLRLLTVLLLGCFLLFQGCSQPFSGPASSADAPQSTATADAFDGNSDDAASGDGPQPTVMTADTYVGGAGRILVAYFSASGNTRAAAEAVAASLDADIFEIVPEDPYTAEDLDWGNASSRVNREHEDESLRTVSLGQVVPDDFDRYDTVILGYPIWWQNAAWPVRGFVAGNDFDGKTVIPFCTSTASDIGQSSEQLEELAGTGTWLEGHRFPETPSAEEVNSWAASL